MIIEYFMVTLAILLFGSIVMRFATPKYQIAFNIALLAALSAEICISISLGTSGTYFNSVSVNPFSLFFMLLFSVSMLLVNLIVYGSAEYKDFALLSDFALLGMYLVAFANSLVTILIGLELISLPTVFILLLNRRGLEAATKFFVMSSISVATLSFAIVLFYGSTGSIALSGHPESTLLIFASILFIASIGFEASIFPFNMWVPDVYQGAEANITAMLGGVNKKAGFVALMQVLILAFISFGIIFSFVVSILAAATMFFGNLAALSQERMKRLMAYSSISQAGYILIGIAAASKIGIEASAFQIFSHMFAFIGVLAIISWLEARGRTSIDDFIGLGNENRLAAIAISVFLLSLMGIPFTAGFIGKFLLFSSAISANMAWLAIVGIINTVISVYYYGKVLIAVYTGKKDARAIRMERGTAVAVAICFAAIVVFGIYPMPIISLASNAASFLVGIAR
ncbi:MAG: NADH-quinone oxidoreductase subunit N [Candidatus Micrarchaeaceae archaeon]